MATVTKQEFDHALQNPELIRMVPTVRHISTGDIYDLWEQMPKGSLPKHWLFIIGIALFLDKVRKEKPVPHVKAPEPTTLLTKVEHDYIAEILRDRANEIATFTLSLQDEKRMVSSVEAPLAKEIDNLRAIATRLESVL